MALPPLTPEQFEEYERQVAEIEQRHAKFGISDADWESDREVGESQNHNLIVANLVAELRNALKNQSGEVYPGEMAVKLVEADFEVHPDVTVVCDKPRFWGIDGTLLLNPSLLIEVFSNDSEGLDRGTKPFCYRSISSLREFLLVAENRRHVEHWVREGGGWWRITDYNSLEDVIALTSIEFELAVAEIYDKVAFPETAPSLREA